MLGMWGRGEMLGSWVGPRSRFRKAGDEVAGLRAWRDVQVASRYGPVTVDRWVTETKLIR